MLVLVETMVVYVADYNFYIITFVSDTYRDRESLGYFTRQFGRTVHLVSSPREDD